jgi:methylated-DNA-[protein]-cysteine S-methyltransferase
MKTSDAWVCSRTDSPLGPLLLAASERGLAGAWFTEGQRDTPNALASAGWTAAPGHPVLQQAAAQLADYFSGRRQHFDLPLDLTHGTAFQQAVWQALLAIPCGTTTSYGELARRIGRPKAVRALGAAVGRNPVSIIVPCHRVIGADGSLTGYAGGLARKTALLRIEGVA